MVAKKCYLCIVHGEKSMNAKKHFVKSKSVKIAKIITEDEATDAHSVLYIHVACLLQAIWYKYMAWEFCFFTVRFR